MIPNKINKWTFSRYIDEKKVKKLSEYYSLDIEIEQGEIKLDNFYCLDGNMYGDFDKEQTNVKEDYYKVKSCTTQNISLMCLNQNLLY